MTNPYQDIVNTKYVKETSSKRKIRIGFLQMYKYKSINSISITALCDYCKVARTTFYSYYNNLGDLINEIEDNLIYELLQLLDLRTINENNEVVYIKNLIKFLTKHHETLLILLINQPDHSFINKWKKAVKYHYFDLCIKIDPEANYDFSLEMLAGLSISSYAWFLDHPDQFNEEKLIETISKFKEFSINYHQK